MCRYLVTGESGRRYGGPGQPDGGGDCSDCHTYRLMRYYTRIMLYRSSGKGIGRGRDLGLSGYSEGGGEGAVRLVGFWESCWVGRFRCRGFS